MKQLKGRHIKITINSESSTTILNALPVVPIDASNFQIGTEITIEQLGDLPVFIEEKGRAEG